MAKSTPVSYEKFNVSFVWCW